MLKILQARLQQYMNRELPDVQAGFRNSRGTRDQIANIWWIMEKAREFQKSIYFCFIDYTRAFVWIKINWKILSDENAKKTLSVSWETCMLDKKQHLVPEMEQWMGSKLGKGYGTLGCILSLCLFKLYAQYIKTKCQAGWSISWNQYCQKNY